MRKTISLLFVLALIASVHGGAEAAQVSGRITSTVYGKVIEVFDADAIAVRLFSGQIAYVKLLGVNASTRDGGLKYMQDNAFGRHVTIVPDYTGSVTGMDGRWNLAYVFLSGNTASSSALGEFLNKSLIEYGFAETDEKYSGISYYSSFLTEQQKAKGHKIGMWGDGLSGYYTISDRVNINTATSKIFETYMIGQYSSSLIQSILGYRSYAPFSTVEELKFVNGMTREIFSANRYIFTVITNINTATEKELRTLNVSYQEDIDDILKYRASSKFNSLTEIYQKAGAGRDFYDNNRYYMCVGDDDAQVLYAKPNRIVNVNTATERQLSDISDVGSSLASKIVSARKNGYTLKTLMELREISNITETQVHRLSDNLHLYTDVNTASSNELESLFGSYISTEISDIIKMRTISDITSLKNVLSDERYNRIEKFIYVSDLELPERVNINTASESQLRDIGISYSDTIKLLSSKGQMKTASQIPFDISAYDRNIALYTNINTASVRELRSLNAFSENAINTIISARNEQPFGSKSELEDYCEEHGLLSAYKSVSEFIVVR